MAPWILMDRKILFVDEKRERHEHFRRFSLGEVRSAYSPEEAIEILAKQRFDIVYLDDLANRGMEVAAFIAALEPLQRPNAVVIHSANFSGRMRMAAVLRDAGIDAVVAPFAMMNSGL